MTTLRCFVFGVCLLFGAVRPAAALGTEFTYQGELRNNGTPVQGSYDLEFRLFDLVSGGTPIAPTQMRAGVMLNNGRFGVNLNFGDVLQGQALWLEIAVRASGQPAFTVLTPRQALRGAPHALHAEFIADNGVSSATVVDGSVLRGDFAVSAIDSTSIVNGGVLTPDFGDGAVGSAALANVAVSGAKLADGAVTNASLANGAVNTAELANAAVTRAKLAPGAVRASHVNSATVQLRLNGSCPFGARLFGFSESGAPYCEDARHALPTNSGLWPKLALRSDGRPVVAYFDDDTDELKVATCGDEACATAIVRAKAVVGDDFEGSLDLVLRSDDTAMVAYRDAVGEDLYLLDCADETCASANVQPIDIGPFNSGTGASLVLRPTDLPIILHSEIAFRMTAQDCADRGCTSSVSRFLFSSNDPFATPFAFVVSATGLPLGFVVRNGELNALVCLDNLCSVSTNFSLLSGTVGGLSAAMAPDGVATVAYRNGSTSIRILRCSGGLAVCDSGTATAIGSGSTDTNTDIAFGADGFPRVAYQDAMGVALRVCSDVNCNANVLRFPDALPGGGRNPSLALRSDGRPVLAYEDFGQIIVSVCAKVDCAP